MPAPRKVRLAETLRAELSQVIRTELRDPRLQEGLLTITGVDISADLRYATVYYSVLGDEKVRKDIANALRGASGVLRAELGRTKAFKNVPELTFRYDESVERGAQLYSAIENAVRHDAELEAEHPREEGEHQEAEILP